MVAYSFKAQFIAPIAAGAKLQTIRADRKRHARPGEELQLYTAMRTKQCALIGQATCTRLQPIRLVFGKHPGVQLGEVILYGSVPLDEFARSDGFDTWADMEAFWRVEHKELSSFSGVLIGWSALK